jgi:hypothetical protein
MVGVHPGVEVVVEVSGPPPCDWGERGPCLQLVKWRGGLVEGVEVALTWKDVFFEGLLVTARMVVVCWLKGICSIERRVRKLGLRVKTENIYLGLEAGP